MDDLLHFLRGEIAMDGDDGTPVSRLDTFIETHYARLQEKDDESGEDDDGEEDDHDNDNERRKQNVDEAFKDFVWRQLCNLPEIKVAHLKKPGETIAAPVGRNASEAGQSGLDQSIVGTDKSTMPGQSLDPSLDPALAGQPSPSVTSLPAQQQQHQPDDASGAGNSPFLLPPLPPRPSDDPDTGAAPADASSSTAMAIFTEAPEAKPSNRKGAVSTTVRAKRELKAERSATGKGMKARDARLAGDEYEFCELSPEERVHTSRADLLARYGPERLRVAADPESCYASLTGSHERRSKLTHHSYQILQAIARGREDGKTVIQLGKEFDHDQKSLFHFVKNLLDMGLIVKLKISDKKSTTSRCIHRHYLETSKHWALWQTKDLGSTEPRTAGPDDEEDEDDVAPPATMSILTVAHVNGNEPLVRARILAALRREPDHILPHLDIVFKIGFTHRPHKMVRRRINRIIVSMVNQGLIEKVGVAREFHKGEQSCIRLLESADAADGQDADTAADAAIEERPNFLTTLAIEKQIVDLLVEAGASGLTIRELRSGLGDLNVRILETILSKHERAEHPPHLCDYAIHSVLEIVGREKRLRWFTIAGYKERCRLDGLSDLADTVKFSHPAEAGGWSALESLGFYETPGAFDTYADSWDTSSKGIDRYAAYPEGVPGKGKKKPRAKSSYPTGQRMTADGRPLGRPRGSTKAAKLQAAYAEGAITLEEYEKQKALLPKYRKTTDDLEREKREREARRVAFVAAATADGKTAEEAEAAWEEAEKAKRPALGKRKRGASGSAAPVEAEEEGGAEEEEQEEEDFSESELGASGTPAMSDSSTPALNGRPKKPPRPKFAPDGTPLPPPVKGRPRKYPVGTTSRERARLLAESRIAMGLPPKATKPRAKKSNEGEASTEGWLGNGKAGPANKPKEPKPRAKKHKEGEASAGDAAAGEGGEVDTTKKPRKPRAKKQKTDDAALEGVGAAAEPAAVTANGEGPTAPTKKPRAKKPKKGEAGVDVALAQNGTSTPEVIDLTAGSSISASVHAHIQQAAGGQSTTMPINATPAEVMDVLTHSEASTAVQHTTQQQQTAEQSEPLLRHLDPASAGTAEIVEQARSEPPQSVAQVSTSSKAPEDSPPAPADIHQQALSNTQVVLTSLHGEQERTAVRPTTPLASSVAQRQIAGELQLHYAGEATSSQASPPLPVQPAAGQTPAAVKVPSGSPASIRRASPHVTDVIEQSTPATRHRSRSSVGSQPSSRPDFVDMLPPSGRQRRAKRFRDGSVNASPTVFIDAEENPTPDGRTARLRCRLASGAEVSENSPGRPGNGTMRTDVSDPSVLGDINVDGLGGAETSGTSADKQMEKKRKAEPTESEGPPPPKRGRGRPRKYPRTGPDPMKPFKYGIYPNLVLYPPIVPRTPVEPDARKTRRQIREEGGSASPAPANTEQEPSMRDLLSRFNQPRHPSPQARASSLPLVPDALAQAPYEPPPTAPGTVNLSAEAGETAGSPSAAAAAAREPEDAVKIDASSAVSQDGQASEPAAHVALPPLPPSVGYILPEMPLPLAGTSASASSGDAGMLASQHNGSFPSDTHFLDFAGNGAQNGAGTIALIPANTVAEPSSKKPERKNYSIMIHENEHALSLKEAGGIATEGSQFTKIWQAYMQKKHGLEQPPNALDRRTHASVMRGLQTRGQVKRTVIQLQGANGKMTQTAVYHLAEISLDGPEMQTFAKALQDEKFNMNVKTNWLPGRKVIRKKATRPEDKRVRNRAERTALLEASIHSEMDARAFFAQEWRIVAQKYGWQFGTIGKARTLHEFLAESINDDNDSSYIISSSPETRIFASPYIIHDLPLALYLKLHAVHGHLGSELQLLDDYLAGEGKPAQTPVSRLPQEISKMLLPEKASNISKTNQLLRILVAFRVLAPIEQTETVTSIVAYSGVDREPRYFRERDFEGSVYWMLANTSPIYDLHWSKGGSKLLISEQSTLDLAGIEQYWDITEAVTFRALDPSELLPPVNDHPATLDLDSTIAPTAKVESRWQRSYMLFKLQKQYIERVVSAQGGATAFLDDEEGLSQLAYKTWAPVDVVRAHVARLANEAERQLMEIHSKPSRRIKKKKTKKSKAAEAPAPESSDSEHEAIEKARRKGKKSKKLKRRLAAEERGEADLEAMRAERRQKEERSEATSKSVEQKKSTADQILARGAKSSKQDREKMWDAIIGRFVAEHGAAEEALDPDQLEFLRVWFVSPGGINAKDLQQHLETMLEDAALVQLPLLSSKKAVLNRPDLGKGKPEDAATVSKITQARRGAPAKPSEKRIARAARAPEAEPVPELPFTLPDVCFVVPENAPRKTPAHGWSEAEDDQLRDFYVILQSRANHLNVRLSLEPARAFYPGLTSKVLVDRLRRLASMHGDAPYLDVLQDTWHKLWLAARAKGEVPDPEPKNFGKFDIAKHRTFLCANVNKQSIRFQAMDPTRSASALYRDLPLDARDLYATCYIEAPNPLRKEDSPKIWDYLYSTITTALKEKDYKYRSLTRPLARLDQAVEAGIPSKDRAAAFSTRYCYRDQKISLECLAGAGRCESSLKSQRSTVWPIPVEDGEMLALSHLFSEDLVDFEVDTSTTLEKRPYRDYRTRKIDDEAFEHDMSVSLKESYKSLTAPLFDTITLPPAESPSVQEAEAEAAAAASA